MATTQSQKSTGRAAKNKDKDMSQTPTKTANDHVGMILKKTREERELDLSTVAEELMIRRFYLDALEEGTFSDLPERVYATGFVRSYATYLGLDAAALSEQFKRDAYGARGNTPYQVELTMPEPMLQSVMPNRAAIMTAIVVLIAIVGGIIYATQSKDDAVAPTAIPAPIEESSSDMVTTPDATDTTEDAVDENGFVPPSSSESSDTSSDAATPANDENAVTFAAPVSSETTTTTSADVKAALPEATTQANLSDSAASMAAAEKRLVIEALKTAWVEVKDPKGAILFTSILKSGQLLPLPNDMVLTVTTGNAGGLRLIKDGKPDAAPLGAPNEVKRNVVLDPSTIFNR